MKLTWITCCGLLVLCMTAGSVGQSGVCEDTDSTACALFLTQKPDLCTDTSLSPLCRRFCGLCPVVCYHCPTAVTNPFDCNTTKECAPQEVCLRKEHLADDGSLEYVFSCDVKDSCDGVGFGFPSMVGRRALSKEADFIERRDLSVKCCDIDKCNMLPATTTTTQATTTTTTPVPTTPSTTLIPVNQCHNDLAFVIDGSTSVGSYNHQLIIRFIRDIVAKLHIGPNDTQVALVEYSNNARVEWHLDDHVTRNDLISAISNIPFVGGSSATHAAIYLLRNVVFTTTNGNRPHKPDVVVMVTDGGTNLPDLAQTEARALHGSGVKVIAVGVGPAADSDELRAIATSTGEYFAVPAYQFLPTIETRLHNLLCA